MNGYELIHNRIELNPYRKLIDSLRLKNPELKSSQLHHIVPKSMGGGNEPDNLVRVSKKDHNRCHVLLAKCLANTEFKRFTRKMNYAASKMTGNVVDRGNSKRKSINNNGLQKQLSKMKEENKLLRDRISYLEKQLSDSLCYISDLEGY